MTGHVFRMLAISALLSLTALASAVVKPALTAPADAPDLEALIPDAFGVWRRVELSQAVLPAEFDIKPGEAVAYRAYRDDLGRVVTLVAAYGPPLGDSVRLHRPEKCYVAQGFEIASRGEREVKIGARTIPTVDLDAQGPSRREAVTYWLRDGAAFTTKPSDNGWRRLARRSAAIGDGALLRVSSVNTGAPQFSLHRQFLQALSEAFSPEASRVFLGPEGGA